MGIVFRFLSVLLERSLGEVASQIFQKTEGSAAEGVEPAGRTVFPQKDRSLVMGMCPCTAVLHHSHFADMDEK